MDGITRASKKKKERKNTRIEAKGYDVMMEFWDEDFSRSRRNQPNHQVIRDGWIASLTVDYVPDLVDECS